jgi:hypothetical protein
VLTACGDTFVLLRSLAAGLRCGCIGFCAWRYGDLVGISGAYEWLTGRVNCKEAPRLPGHGSELVLIDVSRYSQEALGS